MKINQEKLRQYGYDLESLEDMYLYICALVEDLERHNKNYTNHQYRQIRAIADLMKCIEV